MRPRGSDRDGDAAPRHHPSRLSRRNVGWRTSLRGRPVVNGVPADALGYTEEERPSLGAARLGALYTDERVLAFERARIFDRSWSIIADGEELASPGSFVTAT